jgi:multiple sugar transport system permease protein
MKQENSVGRFTIYALLGFGSILFLFPLVWMFITSLKPIEQTMDNPPTWVPRAYTVMIDGEPVDVTLTREVTQPSLWVTKAPGQPPIVVPREGYSPAPGVEILKEIPVGWWLVTERSATKVITAPLRTAVLPRSEIESHVAPRWENYPVALRSMGGMSVEGAEGSVQERAFNPETDATFLTFLSNTIIVCTFGVLGTVLSNALIAYGFARLHWRGRDAFFAVTLATMMVPFPVLMVPLYGVFKELGWIGTLLPLWVPSWFGSAFNIFLMRQFFRTIPEELSEAARIDGASEWRIFWRIILPLSRPVLAVAALFHFLYAWNDFLGPLLYLTRKPTFTLALGLQNFQSQHGGVQWHHLMAASMVTVVPVILLFFFTQKTFVRGIATTGSKG